MSRSVAGVGASEFVRGWWSHCPRTRDSCVSGETGRTRAACGHCTDLASESSGSVPDRSISFSDHCKCQK